MFFLQTQINLETILLNILLDFFLIAIPLSYFHFIEKDLSKLGLKFTNIKKDLINSIIILVALMFFGLILSSLSVFFFPKDAYSLGAKIDIIRTLPLPFLLYLFIVRVFAEEIFFRGLLTNKIGIFFSSVVFGIMHAGYFSFLEIFGAFALGLVLAYFYKKNGTLVPNIVAHIIYNLTVLFFLTF